MSSHDQPETLNAENIKDVPQEKIFVEAVHHVQHIATRDEEVMHNSARDERVKHDPVLEVTKVDTVVPGAQKAANAGKEADVSCKTHSHSSVMVQILMLLLIWCYSLLLSWRELVNQ
jgi:hypothetical protein